MMYKTNGGDVLRYLSIFFALILFVSNESLNASSLKAAQDELNIESKTDIQADSAQRSKFSTVDIKESFLEESLSKNHSLIFGYAKAPLSEGLLQETKANSQFSDMNTIFFSYASSLNLNTRWYVESAYGLSQATTDLYAAETEKLNFNRFLLGSGFEYTYFSSNYLSLSARAGVEQNFLLQVSESGLKDKRKNLAMAKLGLGFYSKSFYEDKLRFRLMLSQNFGADLSDLLIEKSSMQVELEMKL
ncbi:MAG: hypothetical protein VX583_01675 [Bdellovibrionota bacterium]|nr:hypothetical protein [Pseudobdellovibrionaceae bacterium]